ncbi:hypothetical protein KIPB_002046 [Kipferlia bialata]|uniref:Protein kinase domain-containing protein n=1 Tax=Kipferlia bialata TaxID=797122 RepID=A0A9K3CQV6_9EUKA|nr:hypothetical protein KIPB_002046 [Kipferlia bialata]|eukprot:g2046.t1
MSSISHQVYREWFSTGTVHDNKCDVCGTEVSDAEMETYLGCDTCRQQFAQIFGPDKPVLDHDALCDVSHAVLRALCACDTAGLGSEAATPLNVAHNLESMCVSSESDFSSDQAELLGRALAQVYGNQIYQRMRASKHETRAHGVSGKCQPALISTDSELFHSGETDSLFVSLSQSQVRPKKAKGRPDTRMKNVVDLCHPLELSWLPDQVQDSIRQNMWTTEACLVQENIGFAAVRSLQDDLNWCREVADLAVLSYNLEASTLTVYAPAKHAAKVKAFAVRGIAESFEIYRDYQDSVPLGGRSRVILYRGGQVKMVSEREDPCNVLYADIPAHIHTNHHLKQWVIQAHGIKRDRINWVSFLDGIVNYKSEADASRARQDLLTQGIVSDEQRLGATVHVQAHSLLSLKAALKADGVSVVEIKDASPDSRSLIMQSMPVSLTEEDVLSMCGDSTPTGIDISATPEDTSSISLSFASPAECSAVRAGLTTSAPPALADALRDSGQVLSTYSVVFPSPLEADAFTQSPVPPLSMYLSDCHGYSRVYVRRAKYFPMQALSETLFKKYASGGLEDVRVEECGSGSGSGKHASETKMVTFTGLPSVCGDAARELTALTSPLVYKVHSRRHQIMFEELGVEGEGQLSEWCKDSAGGSGCGLGTDTVYTNHNTLKTVNFYGPREAFDEVVTEIRGYFQEHFMPRFDSIDLGADAVELFKANGSGDSLIRGINEGQLSRYGRLEYQDGEKALLIYMYPLDECEKLHTLAVSTGTLVETSSTQEPSWEVLQAEKRVVRETILSFLEGAGHTECDRTCVYCQGEADEVLTICGHAYCKSCMSWEWEQKVEERGGPVTCAKCNEMVFIKHLKGCFSPTEYKDLCVKLANNYLADHPKDPLGMCVTEECCNVLVKADGYQTCPLCRHGVCVACGAMDAESHLGVTCEEYMSQQLRHGSLHHLGAVPPTPLREDISRYLAGESTQTRTKGTTLFLTSRVDLLPEGCPSLCQETEGFAYLSASMTGDDLREAVSRSELNALVFFGLKEQLVRGILHDVVGGVLSGCVEGLNGREALKTLCVEMHQQKALPYKKHLPLCHLVRGAIREVTARYEMMDSKEGMDLIRSVYRKDRLSDRYTSTGVKLGKGCYGMVRQFKRNSDGRLFAVKVIMDLKYRCQSPEFAAHQVAETQALKLLQRQEGYQGGCTWLEEAFLDDSPDKDVTKSMADQNERLVLVFELVDGCELEEVMAARKLAGVTSSTPPAMSHHDVIDAAEATKGSCRGKTRLMSIPIAFVMSHMLQVLSAMHSLQQSNIIHRDIKGANIMVGRDGKVKLIDVGLCKMLDLGQSTVLGQTEIGTPNIRAPEMRSGSHGVAADVYSAGVLFYKYICGLHPYQGDSNTVAGLGHNQDQQNITRLTLEETEGVSGLSGLVHLMLSFAEEERPSADTCHDILTGIIAINGPVREWDQGRREAVAKLTSAIGTIAEAQLERHAALTEALQDGQGDEDKLEADLKSNIQAIEAQREISQVVSECQINLAH